MKNLLKISVLCFSMFFMASCSSDDGGDNVGGGSIPANGWRIGTTNYTTSVTSRAAMGEVENTLMALDFTGGTSDLRSVIVSFSDATGIAAGSYKIVTKLDGSQLLADEINVSAGIEYNNSTSQYGKMYWALPGQSVNATVTITGGKVKIVIPEINIATVPYAPGDPTTTFAGTIIEQ